MGLGFSTLEIYFEFWMYKERWRSGKIGKPRSVKNGQHQDGFFGPTMDKLH
jgi:hypothetical protein